MASRSRSVPICSCAASLLILAMVIEGLPLAERDAVGFLSSGKLVLATPTAAPATSVGQSLSQASPTTYLATLSDLYVAPLADLLASHGGNVKLGAFDLWPQEASGEADVDSNLPDVLPSSWPAPAASLVSAVGILQPTDPPEYTKTKTVAMAKSPGPTATYWSLKKNFGRDLSSDFGVKTWAWGSSLVTAVSALPTMASVYQVPPQPTGVAPTMGPRLNSGNILKVTYPQGSVNPGGEPQGGVGFYAQPIDITAATNVSLAYSLYFPPDFDFVKGGKLPGLYGGHGGCSGGQSSEDCFSTRLMFRKNGMGELYLYVPKGTQSQSLCNTPPTSYCHTTYGYSIGRGAWYWKRGQWSDVKQDIWLNTPGKQDGGFNIWVNGELVLHSNEVMFRKAPAPKSPSKGKGHLAAPAQSSATNNNEPDVMASSAEPDQAASTPEATDPANLLNLDGLLSGLGSALGGVRRRRSLPVQQDIGDVLTKPKMGLVDLFSKYNATRSQAVTGPESVPSANNQLNIAKSLHNVWVTPQRSAQRILGIPLANLAAKAKDKEVTFLGIMFDTFFGGSDPSWATPREQQSYFNAVAMRINAW